MSHQTIKFGCLLQIILLISNVLSLQTTSTEKQNKYSQGAFICRLLKAKFVESHPWIEYSIIYEPIVRGRLTIWSGVSTLPGSEFQCSSTLVNGTTIVTLNFSKFADKFEWTFFDMNNGVTNQGVTINLRENVGFELTLGSEQTQSYLNCNTIDKIRLISQQDDFPISNLRTVCNDCRSSVSSINNLIGEVIKSKLNDELIDALNWQLTQLISSQHFSGPISL